MFRSAIALLILLCLASGAKADVLGAPISGSSSTPKGGAQTIGATPVVVIAATTAHRYFVAIQVISNGGVIACSDVPGQTPAIGTAGWQLSYPQIQYWADDLVPSGAITCVASASNTILEVEYR
jgi:hypothetical protein